MTRLEKTIEGKTPLEAAKAVEDFYYMKCEVCPLKSKQNGGNEFCATQSNYGLTCIEVKKKYLNQQIKTKKVTRISQIKNLDEFHNAHFEFEKCVKSSGVVYVPVRDNQFRDYIANRNKFYEWLFEEIEVEDE